MYKVKNEKTNKHVKHCLEIIISLLFYIIVIVNVVVNLLICF